LAFKQDKLDPLKNPLKYKSGKLTGKHIEVSKLDEDPTSLLRKKSTFAGRLATKRKSRKNLETEFLKDYIASQDEFDEDFVLHSASQKELDKAEKIGILEGHEI
jgi:hypothetical protein